jgi:zinc transporter, ZIP family
VDILILLLASSGTAVATGLGAIPVMFLGSRAEALRPVLWGIAIGAMGVASVVGLFLPALDEGSTASTLAGLALGMMFMISARKRLNPHGRSANRSQSEGARISLLVFLVLLVHSLPEGLAMGTAYASDTAGLGLFVILAIALQNVPEGTSVAIPMEAAGFSGSQQFWAAVGTSVPQPVGALVAYVLVQEVEALLPLSFAFAAGAMLALVLVELVPAAYKEPGWRQAVAGTLAGGGVMVTLSALLGV